MEGYTQEIARAVKLLRSAQLDTSGGMPKELFWLVSSLVPIPNVDLFIVNKKGQLLLARRNDAFYQKSWHIPGGCMRYGETMVHRIHETAKAELGCDVAVEEPPIAIRDVLRGRNERQQYPLERGHNITILFRCWLPEEYIINNGNLSSEDQGYLQWFEKLPEDFLEIQHVYDDILIPWTNYGKEEKYNDIQK